MAKEEQFTVTELLSRLKVIMNEWHNGTRPGNDGNQGNTLEDLLGVEENNLSLPDFGEVEIKTQKKESASLVTLFHFDPFPRPAAVPNLLKALGWKHQHAGGKYADNEMSFRSTTPSNRFTNRGFRIFIDDSRINFKFDPAQVATTDTDATGTYSNYGEWLEDVENRTNPNYKDFMPVYWEVEDFAKKCVEKLDHTLFVRCKTRKVNDVKQFLFDEAFLQKGFEYKNLVQLFDEGKLFIDFDARTGHNHGTKLRVHKDSIPALFKESYKLE